MHPWIVPHKSSKDRRRRRKVHAHGWLLGRSRRSRAGPALWCQHLFNSRVWSSAGLSSGRHFAHQQRHILAALLIAGRATPGRTEVCRVGGAANVSEHINCAPQNGTAIARRPAVHQQRLRRYAVCERKRVACSSGFCLYSACTVHAEHPTCHFTNSVDMILIKVLYKT